MKPRDLIIDLVLVLIFTCGVSAANVHWAAVNQGPPLSDDNTHLYNSLRMLGLVGRQDSTGVLALYTLYPGHYPPLVYQVTLLFYGVMGVAPTVPLISFFPFLLILAFSMYGIGVGLGGRPVGLACAAVGLTTPTVLEFSRTYFLDMPATSMLAATFCCLLHSRNFTRQGWSLAFGLFFGLALLTKWIVPVFIVPWLLASAWSAVTRVYRPVWSAILIAAILVNTVVLLGVKILQAPAAGRQFGEAPQFAWWTYLVVAIALTVAWLALRLVARRFHRPSLVPLCNLLEAFSLCALVAWPWYYYNGPYVREKLLYQVGVPIHLEGVWRSYAAQFSTMVYLAPVLILLGVVVSLTVRSLRPVLALMGSSIALGTVLAVLLPFDPRYLMPVIVFVIPLSLAWTAHLHRLPWPLAARLAPPVQALVLGLVVIAGVWQTMAYETWMRTGQWVGPTVPESASRGSPFYLGVRPALPPLPVRGHFPFLPLLEFVREREATIRPAQEYTWIAVLTTAADAGHFQPRALLYYGAMQSGPDLFVLETQDALEDRHEIEEMRHVNTLLLVYRDLRTRSWLLQNAARKGWISSAGVTPLEKFQFSPNYTVEVLPSVTRRPSST